MPTEVLRAFEARTGIAILEGYGLTEATCVSSVNPIRGERRVGSIGLRLPGQQMKAVVLDERGAFVRDCEVGEVGVIIVSGPNVFAGYRNAAQNERPVDRVPRRPALARHRGPRTSRRGRVLLAHGPAARS